MPRSPLAYLADIVDAADAIERFLTGGDLRAYQSSQLTRSAVAVERQLILIGEAVGSLLRLEPIVSERISHARRIVDFRNSSLTTMQPSTAPSHGPSPRATCQCCARSAGLS